MSTELIPYMFKWSGNANSVVITGSFDNWSQSTILSKANENSSTFLGTVLLPADKPVYFKYVVDGNWTTSNEYKLDTDPSGNVNNLLTVEDLENSKITNKNLNTKSCNSPQLSTDTLTLDKQSGVTTATSDNPPKAVISDKPGESMPLHPPDEELSSEAEVSEEDTKKQNVALTNGIPPANVAPPNNGPPPETLTDTSSYHELGSNFSLIDERGDQKIPGVATSSNAESSFVPIKKDDKSIAESSNFSNIEKPSPAVKSIKSSFFDEANHSNDENSPNMVETHKSFTHITGNDFPTTATADITATRTPPEKSSSSIVIVSDEQLKAPAPPPVISHGTSTTITTAAADGKHAINSKNTTSKNALNSLHLDDLESDASFKSISSNEMFSSTRESFESENRGVGTPGLNSKNRAGDNSSVNNSPSIKINNGTSGAGAVTTPTVANGATGEHRFSLHHGNHSGSSHSLLSKFKKFFR